MYGYYFAYRGAGCSFMYRSASVYVDVILRVRTLQALYYTGASVKKVEH